MKTILDFASDIINNENLISANLKGCFVDYNKRPFKANGVPARPNKVEDFVSLYDLIDCDNIVDYRGIGISIQASNISAIDVDHCFSIPFDVSSGSGKAKDLINLFNKSAYIEFSFSGTGLRILFRHNLIDNYELNYYIKNSKEGIEFYQPGRSFRYVTITGQTICNNPISSVNDELIDIFLNQYMKRSPIKIESSVNVNDEVKSKDELMVCIKKAYLKDFRFQDLWFSKAPGSGKDESERDYKIILYIYANITKDRKSIKDLFETSPFFKSKDSKHMYKWKKNNNAYFYYIYDKLMRGEV